ncbi:hypothetical protein PFISCL1PPCAC_4099, partial [Pristionchus fissidentatus]
VMCVEPERTGFYDINGTWKEKENPRCGVTKIHFDLGCDRNPFFSPFDNCLPAQVGEDNIVCPAGHTMNISLKTLPVALLVSQVKCVGKEWKIFDTAGEDVPHKVTEKDSTIAIRCSAYKQPAARDFTVVFIWVGFMLLFICVGGYRCLSIYHRQPNIFFWRKQEKD